MNASVLNNESSYTASLALQSRVVVERFTVADRLVSVESVTVFV